jgi:hypothetical protein
MVRLDIWKASVTLEINGIKGEGEDWTGRFSYLQPQNRSAVLDNS